jgi:hypothetical protein
MLRTLRPSFFKNYSTNASFNIGGNNGGNNGGNDNKLFFIFLFATGIYAAIKTRR